MDPEPTTDVNTGAGSSPAPDVKGDPSTPPSEQPPTSDGTLKPDGDKAPETVPYARFKEVNDSKNEAEGKLKAYDGTDPDLVKFYKEFDQTLANDPELLNVVKEKMAQGMTKKEAVNETVAEGQANKGADPQHIRNYDDYKGNFDDRFDKAVEAGEIDEKNRDSIWNMVSNEAMKKDPNCLLRYDRRLIPKAWDTVKKDFLDDIRLKERAKYVDEKNNEHTPPSGSAGSAAAVKETDLNTREKRASYLAEGLKAARRT